MREIRMNKERAKKIGAVYYKDIHKKFQPGDYAVNASTGEVVRFPEDQKAFDELRVYHGYFVPVEPTKKYLEAYKMEQRVKALKNELSECEEMQDNLREKAHNEITKGQTHVVCVMMNRRPDEMVEPDEVIRAIGDDRLLSMGRRYNNSRESLWVALVEVDGFTERKGYYGIKNSYNMSLSQVGYRPGDKFHDGIDYVVFNHGERVENPVDQAAIRENERKAEEECRKKAEEEMWNNIKTYDDKNETPKPRSARRYSRTGESSGWSHTRTHRA